MSDWQMSDWHPDSKAIRGGRRDQGSALAPLLWATSTFTSESLDDAADAAAEAHSSKFYSRYGNPSVAAFEDAIAQLEGAESARAFASGMGAVSAVILGVCSQGQHIVAQQQLFGGTQLFLEMACPRFGIDVTFVDATVPGAFADAVRPGETALVLAETPSNPTFALADLDEVGSIAGPVTVVDSTFATPLGQNPIGYGADLVLHSATKSIAGHNDATIGVIAGAEELLSHIWGYAVLHGATASPSDALNALRGVRTLPVRLERQSSTALALAKALAGHRAVECVCYPGHVSHRQHELAKRQMSNFGGVLAINLAGGREAARSMFDAVKLAQIAASLGGPETLVTHPASTTHAGLNDAELKAAGITSGTVRISVGLEHPDDVIADLVTALDNCP